MISETIELKKELDSRTIAAFQREASRKMRVRVYLRARGQEASSKELFELISLNLVPGIPVEICVEGPDEREILENLKNILLGEKENA